MNKKVIIVDDSQSFLMYVGLLVKRMGFTPIPVDSGIEALKVLKLNSIDAVILDVHMSSIDGIAVLKYIREDQKTANLPVIMISVDSSKETIDKCDRLGCCDYLIKPLKVNTLHESLQQCFYSGRGKWRKHIRASFDKKVAVTYNGKQYKFFAEDLSAGGIYVITDDPFPIGSEVAVTLNLEDECSISTKGVVVYRNKNIDKSFERPVGMAIEFKKLTGDNPKVLKEYIENLIAGDILDEQKEPIIEKRET